MFNYSRHIWWRFNVEDKKKSNPDILDKTSTSHVQQDSIFLKTPNVFLTRSNEISKLFSSSPSKIVTDYILISFAFSFLHLLTFSPIHCLHFLLCCHFSLLACFVPSFLFPFFALCFPFLISHLLFIFQDKTLINLS